MVIMVVFSSIQIRKRKVAEIKMEAKCCFKKKLLDCYVKIRIFYILISCQ